MAGDMATWGPQRSLDRVRVPHLQPVQPVVDHAAALLPRVHQQHLALHL